MRGQSVSEDILAVFAGVLNDREAGLGVELSEMVTVGPACVYTAGEPVQILAACRDGELIVAALGGVSQGFYREIFQGLREDVEAGLVGSSISFRAYASQSTEERRKIVRALAEAGLDIRIEQKSAESDFEVALAPASDEGDVSLKEVEPVFHGCHRCDKVYKTTTGLERHLEKVHSEDIALKL